MRVLIVDDSAVSRSAIRRELEVGGYEVLEAVNGEEALALLPIVQPALVTLDVDMPRMDGFETCRRMRAEEAEFPLVAEGRLPIVFITTNDTLEGRMRGFEAGATDFLVKPFAISRLRQLARTLLEPERMYAGLAALLVEESRTMRRIMGATLAELGLRVIEAADGAAAIRHLRAAPRSVQLVLSDYHMAGYDGAELCRRVRQDLALTQLPVVIMSAVDDAETVFAAFRAGATDFLPKPYVKEVFLERVNAHLSHYLADREQGERLARLRLSDPHRAALAQFTASELNRPLAQLLHCIGQLRAEPPGSAQARALYESLTESGRNLRDLVTEVERIAQYLAREDEPGKTTDAVCDLPRPEPALLPIPGRRLHRSA